MDPPRLVGATVVPHAPMADAAARKRKIQDMEDRLKKVEGTVEDHSTRLDTVELRLEEQQQYRFLRVEKSESLDKLWKEVEDGTVGRNTIRGTAARLLSEEVRAALRSMSDAGEETLQTKAAELSGGKRALATAEAREATAAGFVLEDLVEWVSRDGNGRYGIRLTPGEPSRLVGESIRKIINWALYVFAKLGNGGGLQIYPDRGPRTRAKGKGADKGKGKGGGKGKRRGKGKQPGRG